MMSVDRSFRISSILKTPNKVRERSFMEKSVKFEVPDSKRIKSVLLKFKTRENIVQYEDLICSLRDYEINDEELITLLRGTKESISLLNEDFRLFVEVIFNLKWAHRNKKTVKEYQSFLIDLLSAHNYHTKYAIIYLVESFKGDKSDDEWPNGIPSEEEYRKFVNIHYVIKILLIVVPMSSDLLLDTIIKHYPYYKHKTHQHERYLTNLLWILDYRPEFRVHILILIFNKLVILDVNTSRKEIQDFETGMNADDVLFGENNQSLAHTLDVCMEKILCYLDQKCNNAEFEYTKCFYQDMIQIFEKVILPSHLTYHVQFSIFYLCSFNKSFTENFLDYLWKKINDHNTPRIHKQACVAYIASFLARSAFIPISLLESHIELLSDWIHRYIINQDNLKVISLDIRIHAVFYSVCQALFYVIAFRHHDLVSSKENTLFLQNLNLTKIITCHLNPLRMCAPAVVQNFATVTRVYQLVYCHTIIEHNSRSIIPIIFKDDDVAGTTIHQIGEAYFPFDPYLLKRSGEKINSLYLKYRGSGLEPPTNSDVDMNEEEQEDDFLLDKKSSQKHFLDFNYSTSPGFKSYMKQS